MNIFIKISKVLDESSFIMTERHLNLGIKIKIKRQVTEI